MQPSNWSLTTICALIGAALGVLNFTLAWMAKRPPIYLAPFTLFPMDKGRSPPEKDHLLIHIVAGTTPILVRNVWIIPHGNNVGIGDAHPNGDPRSEGIGWYERPGWFGGRIPGRLIGPGQKGTLSINCLPTEKRTWILIRYADQGRALPGFKLFYISPKWLRQFTAGPSPMDD